MFGHFRKKLTNAIDGLVVNEDVEHTYGHERVSPTILPPLICDSVMTNSLVTLSVLQNDSTPLVSNQPSFCASLTTPNGNMSAGCFLLGDYEHHWHVIRNINEVNGQKALDVALQIELIEKCAAEQQQCISDLVVSLASIPSLIDSLRDGLQTLKELTGLSDQVERELQNLENLCEEYELQEHVLQRQFELSRHKQAKMAQLETFRQRVVVQHEGKIRKHEEKLRKLQLERQAVFDDAFRCDLAEYKQRGTVSNNAVHNCSPEHNVALEEVVLDDVNTKDALEEFLNG